MSKIPVLIQYLIIIIIINYLFNEEHTFGKTNLTCGPQYHINNMCKVWNQLLENLVKMSPI